MYTILVINPGSTSTKVAIYNDDKCQFVESIAHSTVELARFQEMMDQLDYRTEAVTQALNEHGVALESIDCIMARGGMLPPVSSGAIEINKAMVDYFYIPSANTHISGIACVIANKLATSLGIQAYVYDPVTTDELDPIARITGIPELPKESRGHVLNTRAVAIKRAQAIGKPLGECTFVIAHLGGGCSVWLVKKGRCVDLYSDDDGCMAPVRAGRVQAASFIDYFMDGNYTKKEIFSRIRGNAGLKAHLGTSDVLEIEARINSGDEKAKLVYSAFAYGVAKCIGDLATAARGKLDEIVLTGGVAHSKMFTQAVTYFVDWIAPVKIVPGEFEMEALALGGLRILTGKEKAKEFKL